MKFTSVKIFINCMYW